MNSITRLITRAVDIVGEQGVITNSIEMDPYGHDEFATEEFARPPVAVFRPETENQARDLVALCAENRVPVTPRGAGTGLSGGCVPSVGGVVLSVERLDRVVEVDTKNQTITVEAGVPLSKLYEAVEGAGLFFPPHPGDEGATVGGAVAANAGGARAVKYGTVRQFVRGLRVVTASGKMVDLGGKYLKSSTGLHLLDLMIGSEGTLGLITQVTFSLLPPPAAKMTLVVPFATVVDAIQSVPALFDAGILPVAVEFVEEYILAFSEHLVEKTWPAKQGEASLLIILDGPGDEEIMLTAERVSNVLENQHALDILVAEDREKQADILLIRSMIYEALRPGTAELLDICVPRSEIAPHIVFLKELEQRIGVRLPTYGHAGDGNVHTHILRRSIEGDTFGEEISRWHDDLVTVRREVYDDTIRRGGVISGEHGVGLVKRNHIAANLGADVIEMMRAVKTALDPMGILNPGKILP
jgi:glycolate oxidase